MLTGQIVVFKLQDQEFGIDIMKVVEILNYCTIRNVPEVPNYIEGIINVRGTVYSIINLRTRLQLEAYEDESNCKFVLLNLEETKIGFMVDNVSEILSVEAGDIEQGPKINQTGSMSCVAGIVKREGRIILILDVDAIISEEACLVVDEISS